MPNPFGLIIGIIVFIAILVGFVWLSKRVSSGSLVSGRRMKIIDRLMVSRDSAILMVQIGNRLVAVGTAAKSSPAFICELHPSDFPEFTKKKEESSDLETKGFWGRFFHHMKANVTGKAATTKAETNADTSFADILSQIAERDPPTGNVAGEAGRSRVQRQEYTDSPFNETYEDTTERGDQIDRILDLVEKRRSRLDGRKDAGTDE